ncbi:filamentous hemagglutinin N-terminal domain-containing protein [Roseomonas eburnea]|uniref:Filamentous hemagglutinin N-terminal domain-containing protein n=1 Tax=Neoroseomonas eburnea TaxID=1346889 RepID=A0A9X9XFL3_9PROT|nr:filamentous hemagglutinin N-terminal domain-containing protein [Neoroseomonas eburnea]MBR0682499.1 filamentous hemagglutinin N-terminal domain-containing protein [Neoroseomonas eburnea]
MTGVATRGRARPAQRPLPAPARTPARRAPQRAWLLATTALLPIAAGPALAQTMPAATTGPTGGQVVAGQAAITQTTSQTTITQGTNRAAIDWQQFNVGSQHTVQFVQPNQGSWTLNRVTGPDPSVIAGRVQANGGVAIVNQSGMVFAGGAQVDVGSLIASAANITNENFMAGRMVFDGAPRPGARVENRGSITVADRGLAALVAPGVANSGVIRARLGRVALGAAETFVLDLAGDGLIGIDVTQAVRTAPEGGTALVTNSGVIEAPGGSVLLSAHAASGLVEDLVRQTGRIEAPSLGERTGEVAIRADGGGVRVEGRVAATGGAGERGGRVSLQATGTVTVAGTARVDASGGAGGGQVLVGTTGRGRNQTMAARTIVESGAEIRADATGTGDGGMLVLNSLERTEMRGALSARGGPDGGNGGFVELSGQGVLEVQGTVDLRAPAGANGELLIDPDNIIVSDTALPATPGGLPAGESITVEITTATGSVTADGGEATEWTRISTAAIEGFAGTVTLDAARDIIVDDAIDKTNGGLTLNAGRNVTIGAAVDVDGALTIAAATGAIAINADAFATSMSLTAATGIAQAGGTVIRHHDGAGTSMNLAATVTGTGNVSLIGDNGRITLRTGGTADGDFTARSTNRVTLGAGQTLSVHGAATLTADVAGNPAQNNPGISLQGTLLADSVSLSANRDITQGTSGVVARIAAGGGADLTTELPLTVAVTGTNRGVSLTGDNGALRLDAGSTQDGDFALRGRSLTISGALTAGEGGARNDAILTTYDADGALGIQGTITARNLSLFAGGAVTQTAAVALGGTGGTGANGLLTIRGSTDAADSSAGSVALTAANQIALIDGRASGAFAFTAASAFGVALAEGSTTTLTGPSITTLSTFPGIVATQGDLRVIADSLTVAGGITAAAGQTVSLRVNALDVTDGSISAGATGTVEIGPRDAAFAVQIGTAGSPANTLELAAADLEGITAGTLRIGRTTMAGEPLATIEAQGLTVAEALAPTAALTLISAAGITLQADVTAPSVRMETTGGAIALGNASVTANGDESRTIELRSAGAITQGADGRLVASGGIADLVAHAQAGSIDLAGTGAFRLADGGTPAGAAGARSLYAAAGDVSFTTTTGLIVATTAEAAGAAANLTLEARGLLLLAPLVTPTAGGVVELRAAGGGSASTITQNAAGIITASLLNLDAEGAIALGAAPNQVGALGSLAFTESFAFRSAGAFTLAAPVAATGGADADISLTVDAGTLELDASINAGAGTVRLEATAGDIFQAAAGAAMTAGRLEVTTSGNALLAPGTDRNQVAVLGTSTVGGTLTFAAAGDLALDGALARSGASGSLAVESGGTLRVNAGASLAFDDIRLVAPGAMTIAGTIGIEQALPVSEVRLGAGAGITQEATGRIVAELLAVRAAGDVDLTAGDNAVRRVAAMATGLFALDTAGTLTTAAAAAVPLPGDLDADIAGVQGSSVTLSAEDLTIQAGTLNGIFGAWASAADGVLTLRADRLTLGGWVGAGDPLGTPTYNGTITVAPRSLARDVSIGLDDPGALFLSQATLNGLVARNLVIGRAEAGAGTVTVAGAANPIDGVNTVRLQGGAIAIDGIFTLTTLDGLVTLHAADGDIVQSAAGAVRADQLALIADAGSVLLGSPGALNATARLSGAVADGERFVFRADGTYTVAAPGIAATGAEVDLSSATGSILQALGAPILADRLVVAAAGSALLDGGGSAAGTADLNRVGTLYAPSGGTTLLLRNADPLTVEAAGSTALFNGGVVLEAPTIHLTGDVTASTAGGHVVLRTGADFDAPASGDITQSGGIIRTQDLSVSAGGDITLSRANEVIRLAAGFGVSAASANSVVATGGGAFLISNSLADLQVAAPVSAAGGGGIAIFSNGISVAPALLGTVFLAPGGVVQFAPFTAGGSIGLGGTGGLDTTTITAEAIERVSADRLIIGGLAPFDGTSSGTITLRGNLDLTGPGAPTALELRSGGDIVADGFALSVAQLSAHASGNIAIGTAASRIGSIVQGLGDATAGIRAGGTLVRLTSAGVDAGSGLFTIAAPIVTGAGGTIALQAPDFALGAALDTGAGAAGRIELRSTRGVSLGGALAEAGTARLTEAELALLDAHGGTLLVAGPAINLSGDWTLDPADAARLELLLTAGGTGTITQTAGSLSAAALAVTALQGAGTVQIDLAGNSLPVVEAAALGGISVATGGALEVRRTTSAAGGVTYRATDITLSTAGLTPGQFTIDAPSGAVTLTASAGDVRGTSAQAAVRGTTLTATANEGEIRLSGDNAVGTLSARARDGVVFRNTGALTARAVGAGGTGTAVDGDVDIAATALTLNDILATGTVTLQATTGDLLQAGGAGISAAALAATAAGSLRLAGANGDGTARNMIEDVTALSAGGDITLRNALALTIDLPLSVGTDRVLTLEAPTLTLTRDLSAAGANGQIILRTGGFAGGVASGGDIQQTGGTISAARLAALAGGTVSLDQAGNAIGALGGGLDAAGTALGLGLSAGGSATVRSLGFGGSATLGVTGALQVANGGTLTLRADDLAIGAELRAPGGIITLLPVSTGAGIGYVLGGAAGSATAGRITLDEAELAFLPSGTPAAELRLGAVGTTGSIDITGTVDLVDGANGPRVGRLTLAGDGALTQAAGSRLDVAALSAQFPNGAVRLDPGVAGNRIAAIEGVTAGGEVLLRGGAGLMEVRGAVSAAAGTRVVLRADDLDIQAPVRAPAGTIAILPETPGRTVTLGGAGAGTLALDSTEIARLGGAGAALDAPGALRLVIGSDGSTRSAGDILVTGDVPLRDGASVRVGTLELVAGAPGIAGGSVRQTAGSVDVAAVTGTAQGDFQLGLAGNAYDTATGITAGTLPATGATGAVALGTAGALAASGITAPVSVRLTAGAGLTAGGVTAPAILLQGAAVTLTGLIQGADSVAIESAGAVTQQAGALIITDLFTLNGGQVSLPEDNQILELGDLVASGPVLALNTVLPLLVSGAVSANGSLSFSTDQGLTVASGGSVTVTGGPGTATLTAGGNLTYLGLLTTSGTATLAANGTLSFTGTGSIGGAAQFSSGAAMTLGGTIGSAGAFEAHAGGALGTTAQITAGDDAMLSAGGVLTAGNRITSSGGDLVLTGGNGLTASGDFLAGGVATLRAANGALSLSGTLTAGGTIDVSAGGALGTTAQVTAGGTARFTAGGILTAGNRIESTGGDLVLSGAGGLDASGTLAAAQAARLLAGGSASLAGRLSAGTTAEVTAGGTLRSSGEVRSGAAMTLASGATMTLGGTHVAGGNLSATAGGDLVANGTVQAAGAVTLAANGGSLLHGGVVSAATALLSAGGGISQTGTVAAGGDLRLTAGGGLVNTGTLSAGGALALAAGGAFSHTGVAVAGAQAAFAAGGPVTISGQTTAGTAFDLTTPAAATLTGGKITAGTAVRLAAGQGITMQGFQIDPTSILLQTGGAIVLTDNTLVSSDSITLTGGAISIRGGSMTTGTLGVDSSGTLNLDGGRYVIGRAVAFSAPGGIVATNRVTVVPRDGVLPAVVFDTRASGGYADPLTQVQPDIPGLQPRQQATQVRIPGSEAPGSFGPASGGPAGLMVLDIDAGRSAVFLLLDGGTATGTIHAAGRLGIHGTGGSAELLGSIADSSGNLVSGAAAARFADSTRPAASGALTRYRINGCVVSSINCIVPSQVITIPQAPPQRVDIRLGGGRITDPDVQIPNVAEEDY